MCCSFAGHANIIELHNTFLTTWFAAGTKFVAEPFAPRANLFMFGEYFSSPHARNIFGCLRRRTQYCVVLQLRTRNCFYNCCTSHFGANNSEIVSLLYIIPTYYTCGVRFGSLKRWKTIQQNAYLKGIFQLVFSYFPAVLDEYIAKLKFGLLLRWPLRSAQHAFGSTSVGCRLGALLYAHGRMRYVYIRIIVYGYDTLTAVTLSKLNFLRIPSYE